MSRHAATFILPLMLACSSTPGSGYTPPSSGVPKPQPGSIQGAAECQTNAECTAKLTLATCEVGRCEYGKCVARPAALGTSCAMAASGDVALPPCKTTICDGEGHCGLFSEADGAPCGASDACHRKSCSAGVCNDSESAPCFDENPCTTDSCDPVVGCVFTPSAAPCEDGNPCTAGDACKDGFCTSGESVCECNSDTDCKGKDTNLCDGSFICKDKKCVNDDANPVVCIPSGALGACEKSVCAPKTGECVAEPNGAAPCDDGNACTDGDYCSDAGACLAGKKYICEKCTGGIDEDGDTAVDCDDDDCTSDESCAPPPPPADEGTPDTDAGPVDQDAGSPEEDTTPADEDTAT